MPIVAPCCKPLKIARSSTPSESSIWKSALLIAMRTLPDASLNTTPIPALFHSEKLAASTFNLSQSDGGEDAPGVFRSYPVLALTWTSMRLLHLWLRYQSLSVLLFNTGKNIKAEDRA
ncbi:uncharacterized protein LOC122294829 [Carya illinoinensis]|uniref:uncharacterized protein LOC122294829 n=1 Tax=Carya illinoinensis TaxID=32201 RepID=UPI001C71D5CC|nr:uncharacterized protein LOC122294829 [Carya illinoinensis]